MARSRGYAEYSAAPLRRGRGRGRGFRRGWLRTAQLNLVGWAALLGTAAAAAAVGVVVSRVIGRPGRSGAALGVVPLCAVVLLDRRRWAAMETSFGWGASPEDVARIASELRARGVDTDVSVDPTTPAEAGLTVGATAEGGLTPTASLTYRNRDAKRVEAMLRAHGIHSPHHVSHGMHFRYDAW